MAGAGLSVTREVREIPLVLTQVTDIMLPGRPPPTSADSAPGEATRRPFAAVITSPAAIPAIAAGVPHSTPITSAPARAGAIEAGTAAPSRVLTQDDGAARGAVAVPPPRSAARCLAGDDDVPGPTMAPRKPPTPRLMPGPGRPAAICRSAAIAVLIGIA